MTESNDYGDYLDRSWDDLPVPLNVPVGTWRLRCEGAVLKEPEGFALITLSPQAPMEDVDDDEMEKMGDYDYTQNRVFVRYYLDTVKKWDGLRKHVLRYGVDLSGISVRETFEKKLLVGAEIGAYINLRTYDDNAGERVEENDAKNFYKISDE